MNTQSIRTEREYRRALREIETLMGATPDTRAGTRLDELVSLVEAWETKHYPLDFAHG